MKKTVHYSYKDRLPYIQVGVPAYVRTIDHPGPYVSNTTIVRTTNVIRVGEAGEFETENTIYVPAP